MAASDTERRAGDEHVRAGDLAGVDAFANGDIGEAGSTDVADRGEASEKREARVLYSGDCFARNADSETCVAIPCWIGCDVRVDIYKAGEASGTRKIDRAGWQRGACRGDRGDGAVGVKRDELIVEEFSGADVNEFTAAHCAACGSGL